MYKRPAHIFFVGSAERASQLPCELLSELGGEYLQGRCMASADMTLLQQDIAWADLIIALDAATYELLSRALPERPLRQWSLPEQAAARLAYVRDALNSMAAGMRMLQRQDA